MNGWILALTVLKLAVSFSMIVVGVGMMIQIPILKSSITTYAERNIFISKFLLMNVVRTAAILNWVGITLTVLQIILTKCFLPNDLQKWCDKSVFGLGADKFKNLDD